MFNFFKNYNLSIIKRKLLIIYLLNVTDIFFTLILVNSGYFYEGNTLMAVILNTPILAILCKTLIPATLIVFVYNRMKKATLNQLIYSNKIIVACILFYSFINLLHLIWLIMLKLYIK
ncbi:DUF5658 family protein [Clostridium fungisolvens]|uniref:DUF5658 domain-containing protein n=1 Tax=Clostridium fungisolvens TaxID=1604897 RepID=A0A6V8SMA5_9CLOT|nr:DUF5658 family protein [Clostridium fungisolvens]GFP76003.1 hypothetical protein bsdtw1_02097 [Clostridium fungisolvens]